jgi:hypothetical protein
MARTSDIGYVELSPYGLSSVVYTWVIDATQGRPETRDACGEARTQQSAESRSRSADCTPGGSRRVVGTDRALRRTPRRLGNGQRATGNGQQATGNGQRATGNGQRATGALAPHGCGGSLIGLFRGSRTLPPAC